MASDQRDPGSCLRCGEELMDEGFVEDVGHAAQGSGRCRSCGHLELFANDPS